MMNIQHADAAKSLFRPIAGVVETPHMAEMLGQVFCVARKNKGTYTTNHTSRRKHEHKNAWISERGLLKALNRVMPSAVLEFHDYYKGKQRYAVTFPMSFLDAVQNKVDRDLKAKRKANARARQLLPKPPRSPKTYRVRDPIQSLTRESRAVVYQGWFSADMRKAHLGVFVSKHHAPFSRALYDNQDVAYTRLAKTAQCSLKAVKDFVNVSIIGHTVRAHREDGWFQSRLDEGMGYEHTKWSLSVLVNQLHDVLKEFRDFHFQEFPGLRGKQLMSEVSSYLTRYESQFIAVVEREAQRLGILTHNLHDGTISEQRIPDHVFDTARAETGLHFIKVENKVIK